MEILKFIFYLGIIYAIFGLLWSIINFLYKSMRGNPSKIETVFLQGLGYYFLASLTVTYLFNPFNLTDHDSGSYAFMVLGGIVLYFYLLSKLNKKKNIVTLFGNQSAPSMTKIDKLVEVILIVITLLFYLFTLLFPEIANHAVNNWFYTKIQLIYDTVLLNFIFGIIGIVFLIRILFQGMASSGFALNLITGNQTDSWSTKNSKDSDHYDDYEIVDEDVQEDSSSNLLN
ncbi:MAG: hypothetical protein HOH13_10180 [Crocinitomicaceae bacterium]|nr:hypothetical protein [Crocinitomicaceae bacterium]MDG2331728.1 hypothetical protein [Flavobacteriales bacterium]